MSFLALLLLLPSPPPLLFDSEELLSEGNGNLGKAKLNKIGVEGMGVMEQLLNNVPGQRDPTFIRMLSFLVFKNVFSRFPLAQ